MAFTYVNSAEYNSTTGTGGTCNKPTGTVEGDIMFALVMGDGATNYCTTIPTGWVKLNQVLNSGSGYKFELFYKLAGASEPSNYTWDRGTDAKIRIHIATYRDGFYGAVPINVYSARQYVTSDVNNIAREIDVYSTNSPIIFIGGAKSTVAKTQTPPTNPDTFTEDYDNGNIAPDFWDEFAHLVWSGSGNTGDIVSTINTAIATKWAFAIALYPSEPDYKFVGHREGFSLDAGATQTSIACLKPELVQENDIMFALVHALGTSLYSNSVPTGWTKIGDNNGTSGISYELFYKVAGASEGTDYTWGWASGSQKLRVLISAFRGGFDTSDPIDTYSATAYTTNNTTNRAAGVTVANNSSIVLYFGSTYGISITKHTQPTNGSVSLFRHFNDYEPDTDCTDCVASIIMNSGATGDFDATIDVAGTNKMAFLVALNPAPSGSSVDAQTLTGSLTIDGFAPTIIATNNKIVSSQTGSTTIAGFAPNVVATDHKIISTDVASLSFAGFAPTVTATNHKVVLSGVGSLSVAGLSSIVVATNHKVVLSDLGQLTVNSFAPTVVATNNKLVSAGLGALIFTGYAPAINISNNIKVYCNTGSLTITGNSSNVLLPKLITTNVGSLTINGFAPNIDISDNKVILSNTASLSISSYTPTVIATNHKVASTLLGQLTITGLAPTVTASDHKTVLAGLGQLTFSGFAPIINIGIYKFPATGQLTITGFSTQLNISDNKRVSSGLGVLTFSSFAPTVTVTDHKIIQLQYGEILATGFNPSVVATTNTKISCLTGQLTINGFIPTIDIIFNVQVSPSIGQIIFTGYKPRILKPAEMYYFDGEVLTRLYGIDAVTDY